MKNSAIHDLAERYLHLLAECVIDIGNHIVADQNLGSPASYGEIFQILQDNKIIGSKLSSKLQDWASYRNVLVHGYLKIDHSVAYELIKEDFQDIEEFKNVVQNLI